MSMKLPLTDPPFDLNALLGISDTNGEGVSAANPISDTKISATNGQKINAWKKANRDTLRLDLPKGEKARLKAEAARRGMSLTAMVKAALTEYLERRPAE